jgi:hypothetical protein
MTTAWSVAMIEGMSTDMATNMAADVATDMDVDMATGMTVDMNVDVLDDVDADNPCFHGPVSSGPNILMDYFSPNNYFRSFSKFSHF